MFSIQQKISIEWSWKI